MDAKRRQTRWGPRLSFGGSRCALTTSRLLKAVDCGRSQELPRRIGLGAYTAREGREALRRATCPPRSAPGAGGPHAAGGDQGRLPEGRRAVREPAGLLDRRVAVLDGAWGTMFQSRKLTAADYRLPGHERDTGGDPDLLNLTRPDVVLDVHRQYLAAGADITTTNTFTATSFGQADYGLQSRVYEMNLRGAQIARRAADEADGDRYVAGSVGPLNVTLSLSPKVDDPAYRAVSFDQVKDAYAEQIAALAEGGVDLLLIETVFAR
jgi:5-methyltetrahydrofolate--homocysteine methyltransferase